MESSIWDPLRMGSIQLQHRIVMAPMTRGRATPSMVYERTYYPNALMQQYYAERTTLGGLLITEAITISLRASCLPGTPGISTDEQIDGWKRVVDAVHERGGLIVAQLWSQGRLASSQFSGLQPWGPSEVQMSDVSRSGTGYEVPHAMSTLEIQEVQGEYVQCAINCMTAGFDGIEVHGANGYLPDQFHHSNINTRTDAYGGSIEKRCYFSLELTKKLCHAIGAERVGYRLTPFGLFNGTLGEDRENQWTYLCKELAAMDIAYIHLIEPRFDEFRNEHAKLSFISSTGMSKNISLRPFRDAIKSSVAVIAAGGYTWDNAFDGIKRGDHDAVAFGRYFTSNPDLVNRLRNHLPFHRYVRAQFYGPFDNNEAGYTIFESKMFADESDRGVSQL